MGRSVPIIVSLLVDIDMLFVWWTRYNEQRSAEQFLPSCSTSIGGLPRNEGHIRRCTDRSIYGIVDLAKDSTTTSTTNPTQYIRRIVVVDVDVDDDDDGR